MRALRYIENPVTQAYNGGDQLNIRSASNAFAAINDNFQALEQAVDTLDNVFISLNSRLDECYAFIDWVQKHSPETAQAYKAHNTVLHTFDKAAQAEFVYPQAETPT